MRIEWLGHSCFRIRNDEGKAIVTDPFCAETGIKLPDYPQADIVTVSHHHGDHDNLSVIKEGFTLVEGEGDFCISGINIKGVTLFHDKENGAKRGKNTVFTFDIDGLRVCHMGDTGETCSEEIAEKLGNVDILLIPVGGTYTVDAKEAKDYVDRIKPAVVIPMHYKSRGCIYDIQTEEPFISLCEEYDVIRTNAKVLSFEKEKISRGSTSVIIFDC